MNTDYLSRKSVGQQAKPAPTHIRFPVILHDVLHLAPDVHEYFVRGFTHARLNNDIASFVFIPNRDNLVKRGLLAANSVVHMKNGFVPIRIYRTDDSMTVLHPRTHMGWIERVEEKSTKEVRCVQHTGTSDDNNFMERFKLPTEILTSEQGKTLSSILQEYRDVFSSSTNDIGCTNIQHNIETGDNPPITVKPRRLPLGVEDQVEDMVRDMLETGIIRRSQSPWSFPLVIVRKKNGAIRLCVDYRLLNGVTKRPIYPIPDCKEFFDTLAGSRFFSALDLSQGYHQMPMNEEDKQKTAFTTRSGQYEYNRMPFGLSGAPATFQRVMNVILRAENFEKCVIYLDDVLVFGRTLIEHNERLICVLQRFREACVKLSPSKCQFMKQEVVYLGHIIDQHGVHTDPAKVKKVQAWPTPNCPKELHSFLGFCNYYRRFIKDYAIVVQPLQKVLNAKVLLWNDNCQSAFVKLKELLSTTPVLVYPKRTGLFVLDTDASHGAIGAVLSQIQDGEERVIAYASNTLTKAQDSTASPERSCSLHLHTSNSFDTISSAQSFSFAQTTELCSGS